MNKNQDKGFTLVELLIVIVILGILATVTVFAVRGITDQGQDNACAVSKRTVETALESYYAQNQTNATAMSDLTTGPVGGGALLKDDPTAGANATLTVDFGAQTVGYTGDCA